MTRPRTRRPSATVGTAIVAVLCIVGCDDGSLARDAGKPSAPREGGMPTLPIADASPKATGSTPPPNETGGKPPGIEEGWVAFACCKWGCHTDADTNLYWDFAIPAAQSKAVDREECQCGTIGWDDGCDTDPCLEPRPEPGPICMFGVLPPTDGDAGDDDTGAASPCRYANAARCDALVRCVEESGTWARAQAAGVEVPACGDEDGGS